MTVVINSEMNSPNSAVEDSGTGIEGRRRRARQPVKSRKKRGEGDGGK